jgi:hypothetical protein
LLCFGNKDIAFFDLNKFFNQMIKIGVWRCSSGGC